MPDAQNHYQIEFDVPGCHHEPFQAWLASNAVEWINHESVACFSAFQNDTGLSPAEKFVFGFETLQDWVSFVESGEHRTAMRKFETLADNRDAVLWQPAPVKLDAVSKRLARDDGQHNGTGHTNESDSGFTQ